MSEKRYSLVRVDNKKEGKLCPLFENEKLCNIEKNCWNCKIKYQYGDTKSQLILKVAQVLKRELSDTFKNTLHLSYKELAKEIVEFLGIKD